jgi:pimeloyl-ACP methyl ester carboxylesterase
MNHPASPLFPGFAHHLLEVSPGISISAMVGGQGPGLLLLHGHPQTLAIWHKVAPMLAQHFTVVAADLRGYGDSSKPEGGPDHAAYAKRSMAQDQVDLMQHLGFARFAVLAHDRGARVAHRLGMDHPQEVRQMVLLDIAPTLAMYAQTTEAFARAYWHWFFLIQPQPLPATAPGETPVLQANVRSRDYMIRGGPWEGFIVVLSRTATAPSLPDVAVRRSLNVFQRKLRPTNLGADEVCAGCWASASCCHNLGQAILKRGVFVRYTVADCSGCLFGHGVSGGRCCCCCCGCGCRCHRL